MTSQLSTHPFVEASWEETPGLHVRGCQAWELPSSLWDMSPVLFLGIQHTFFHTCRKKSYCQGLLFYINDVCVSITLQHACPHPTICLGELHLFTRTPSFPGTIVSGWALLIKSGPLSGRSNCSQVSLLKMGPEGTHLCTVAGGLYGAGTPPLLVGHTAHKHT